jgi:hypothetical protein
VRRAAGITAVLALACAALALLDVASRSWRVVATAFQVIAALGAAYPLLASSGARSAPAPAGRVGIAEVEPQGPVVAQHAPDLHAHARVEPRAHHHVVDGERLAASRLEHLEKKIPIHRLPQEKRQRRVTPGERAVKSPATGRAQPGPRVVRRAAFHRERPHVAHRSARHHRLLHQLTR